MKSNKIYHYFESKFGHKYEFENYDTFATWFFNHPFRYINAYFTPEVAKKLRYAANHSVEARTPKY